jgi:outer membrane murein-binding lipoprotein Lpp
MRAGRENNNQQSQPELAEVADFIRKLASELEHLSEDAGLETVAACLRAASAEARRAKDSYRLAKLGLKPTRRLV